MILYICYRSIFVCILLLLYICFLKSRSWKNRLANWNTTATSHSNWIFKDEIDSPYSFLITGHYNVKEWISAFKKKVVKYRKNKMQIRKKLICYSSNYKRIKNLSVWPFGSLLANIPFKLISLLSFFSFWLFVSKWKTKLVFNKPFKLENI